jgi:hypothetical protein
VSRWLGPWIAVGLALLPLCAWAAPPAAAPPAWVGLAGRGGQVTVEPLKADADGTRLPAYAARIRIEPGAVRSGFRSEGTWLGELLAAAPEATTLTLRIRVTAAGPVTLAISCPGMDGVTNVPVLPRGSEAQDLHLPLAGPFDPAARRLLLTTDRPCTVEVLGAEPTAAGTTPVERLRANVAVPECESLESVLRDLALLGALPADCADGLLRARADLYSRADGAALAELLAQQSDSQELACAAEMWVRVDDRLARAERHLSWVERVSQVPEALVAGRRYLRSELWKARRALAAGQYREVLGTLGNRSPRSVSLLAAMVLGYPDHLCGGSWAAGLEIGRPVLRDGHLEWRDGAAFVPIALDIGDGRGLDPLWGTQAGLSVWVWSRGLADAPPSGGPPTGAMVDYARSRLDQGGYQDWPIVLRLHGPLPPSEVPQTAARLIAGCADRRSLCGVIADTEGAEPGIGDQPAIGVQLADLLDGTWAAERQRADDLVEAVREVAPTLPPMVAPANPSPALPRLQDVLAGACGPVGSPSAIGLPQSPLARRLAASAAGSGLRTTRVTALDQGRVPAPRYESWPLAPPVVATGTLRAVAQATSDRPHRVAVICSAREVVLERSRAMELVELLRHLDVDADLLVDLELAHSGRLPRVYKALLYETGSLDERAFTVAWRSGLPMFLIGAPQEDRRGETQAAAVLQSLGAFLARPTGNWRPSETPREVGLPDVGPTVIVDPLELALGAGWLKADAPPAPAQESAASLGLAGRPWLAWHTWSLSVTPADAAMGGRLLVPSRVPVGCQIVLNGELLGQGLDGPLEEDNPLDAMTFAARPGLLRGDIPNRLALGIRHGQTPHPGLAQGIRFVPEPLMTMRVAEALGPMAVNEEQTCWTPTGTPAFPPDALARDARAIAVEKGSGRPLLIRQSNSLLWAGALPTGSPVLERMVSGFLANLGEAHVYPPSQQTARTEITDTPGGVLVYRKDGDPLEIVLGGRSLLVPAAGLHPDHQRIGGATVVGFRPAEPLGSFQAFRRSELEVVPDSGEVTVTALTRDFARPECLAFRLTTSGPASRLVLHSPFASAPQCSALIDATAADVRRRGANWELRVPQGTHQVELSAYCQAVLDDLLREPE